MVLIAVVTLWLLPPMLHLGYQKLLWDSMLEPEDSQGS